MTSQLEYALGLELLLAVWIGVRSYRVYHGRQFSAARVLIFPVLVLLLFLGTELATVVSVPWAYPWWTVLDLALVAVSAAATWPVIGRLVKVTRRGDGQWYYQYGIELISFYLGMWVVRLVLAAYYDPASLVLGAPPSTGLSATACDVLVLIQGLFAVSSGVVIGRAIGTYQLVSEAQRNEPLRSAASP